MNFIQNCSKIATLLFLTGVASCTDSVPAPEPSTASESALENPIAACQGDLATCQQGGRAGCQDQMRACMTDFADWLRAVQAGVQACRERAAQCAMGAGGAPRMCRADYDRCVMKLVNQPGDTDDAGTATGGRGGRGAAGTGGAGREANWPGRGGQSGMGGAAGRRGLPGLPGGPGGAGRPGLPGTGRPGLPGRGPAADGGVPGSGAGPEMQCADALRACMASGRDMLQCAEDARRCLRDSRP